MASHWRALAQRTWYRWGKRVDRILYGDRAATGRSAGVPFMITREMRERLAGLGYRPRDIARMTPADAQRTIANGVERPSPAPRRPPPAETAETETVIELGPAPPPPAPAAPPAASGKRTYATSAHLRGAFLDHFAGLGHEIVPSSSLVPPEHDETLLFANAGMNQFKDYFTGAQPAPYARAASAQRCVRAGGKHNDLDNVGHTARHHTFFEMLGSFYFAVPDGRRAAIHDAWGFLTDRVGLDAGRLRVSVHRDDPESYELWRRDIGLADASIVRLGDDDNFWSMGDGPGPCGPCTEIFFDQGQAVDGDRWLEIWNLVFMTQQRTARGVVEPLPAPCVDTGMGLERLAAVVQGRTSNYDNDVFSRLVAHIAGAVPRPADPVALRVVADHLRGAAFLLADGVVPSNVGRGYVLRRIVRRALAYAHAGLGCDPPFLHTLVPALSDISGSAYPGFAQRAEVVADLLRLEESTFVASLAKSRGELAALMAKHADRPSRTVTADEAFRLYDTHGLPFDLADILARQGGWSVDTAGARRRLDEHKASAAAAAAAAAHGSSSSSAAPESAQSLHAAQAQMAGAPSCFVGHDELFVENARVTGVAPAGKGRALVVVDPCPFYGAGGGQVGDRGWLHVAGGAQRLEVIDTVVVRQGLHAALVATEGAEVREGDTVDAEVLAPARRAASVHHTATHLLHASLRNVLGSSVRQAGSAVTADGLRFDFTHERPLSDDELTSVQDWVNAQAMADVPVTARVVARDDPQTEGAMSLFSDKYGDEVRVVDVAGASRELCGGTHAASTREVYPFRIVAQSAVAAGTRRIQAVCGMVAAEALLEDSARLAGLARGLEVGPEKVAAHVEQLGNKFRDQLRLVEQLRDRVAELEPVEAAPWRNTQVAVCDVGDSEILRRMALHRGGLLVSRQTGAVACAAPDAARLLRDAVAGLGGKGGGKGGFAQGRVPQQAVASLATSAALAEALGRAN